MWKSGHWPGEHIKEQMVEGPPGHAEHDPGHQQPGDPAHDAAEAGPGESRQQAGEREVEGSQKKEPGRQQGHELLTLVHGHQELKIYC